MPASPAPKFYDPLTERWYTMPAPAVIERAKPPTEAERIRERYSQNLRIAAHGDIWKAIEATATATQTATPCPAGSESDASAS